MIDILKTWQSRKNDRRILLDNFLNEMTALRSDEGDPVDIWLSNIWECYYYECKKGELQNLFFDSYMGRFESEVEFAENFLGECESIPDHLIEFFDMNKYAESFFNWDYIWENGYVFHT